MKLAFSRVATLLLLVSFDASAVEPDEVGRIIGVQASKTPDGVVRATWGRTDVQVRVDGVRFKPFAGLTSWAAFKPIDHGTMLMGDTVVFEDEVNPAMDAAFANGIEVTALHNHFFFDDPKVYFMHIGGHGDAQSLARGVRAVWDAVKAVRAAAPQPAKGFAGSSPAESSVSAEPLAKILQLDPATSDGIVKFTVGRDGQMHGVTVGGSMGLTTWAAFCGTDESAMVAGDLIMIAREVQPVLRALRAEALYVVSLHNHMIGEAPAYYFVHFWGKGRPADLAAQLKRVIDAQAQVPE